MVRKVINKFAAVYRTFGVAVGTAYLGHRFFTKLGESSGLYVYHFYEQLLDRPEKIRESKFTFEWLDSFSSSLLVLPRPKERLEGRFNGNTRCLLGKKNGEFVSCAWFASKLFNEDEVNYRVALAPHQVWDFDVFVTPEYRLGRLFFYTWQKASFDLGRQGFRTSLSRISAYNLTSITTHEKLGAKRVGSAMFLKISGFQITVATRKPYLAVSLGEKGKPFFDFSDSVLCQ